MLTLTGTAWFTPRSAGMCLMLNCMSALGFIYNRGLPPVPRDDMGQVGEIRPMKPKPMALSVGITAFFWLVGFWKVRDAAHILRCFSLRCFSLPYFPRIPARSPRGKECDRAVASQ